MSESIETKTEELVVAELAQNPELFAKVFDLVKADMFASTIASEVFQVLRDQWANHGSTDPIHIARLVNERGRATSGQAFAMLTDMNTSGNEQLLLREIDVLKDFRMHRKLKELGEQLMGAQNAQEARAIAERVPEIVDPPKSRGNAVRLSESYHKVIEDMNDVINGNPKSLGISTGIPRLDALTGGFKGRRLWIVSGETSDGKSMLTQGFAHSVVQSGHQACIYSWEMPDEDIARRGMASVASIPLDHLVNPAMFTRETQSRCSDAVHWMDEHGTRLTVVNASDLEFAELMTDIRIRVLRDGIKLVVIDYLQLIDLSALDKSREQQIAKGVSALYRLCQSLGFTLVILSQLNDDGKLRESRAPGFDADVVLTIQKVMGEDGVSDETRRNIFVNKNRGGPRNETIFCLFQGQYARFAEMEQSAVKAELERRKPASKSKAGGFGWKR